MHQYAVAHACHRALNSPATIVHLVEKGAETHALRAQKVHQNFPRSWTSYLCKFLCFTTKQRATAVDKNYAQRHPREPDKLRELDILARRDAHQLAAVLR